MPDWMGGVLVVAAIIAGVYAWETVKEKAKEKGGRLGRAAELADGTEELAGNVFHTLFQKGGGLLMLAVTALLLWSMSSDFNFLVLLGALLTGAYALYLLWPGRRSFWVFF
ncbi:MAG TPA: hypothetical protein GXZ45_03605 [Propionibacterium sp.]|nr:hypothetical protein [Propionibacterium sp.]